MLFTLFYLIISLFINFLVGVPTATCDTKFELRQHRKQRQRTVSPTVTPPGMLVNSGYVISTKGTSSKKNTRQWNIHPPLQAHSATQMRTGIRQNQVFSFVCFSLLLPLLILLRRSRPHSVSDYNKLLRC